MVVFPVHRGYRNHRSASRALSTRFAGEEATVRGVDGVVSREVEGSRSLDIGE